MNRDVVFHDADVLVMGAGASGCGAALAAREEGKNVLLVDKGKLESCGSIGAGNDHFMGVLNSSDPYDSVDDMVNFFCKPGNGVPPETVRAWGEAMPHLIEFLTDVGVEFQKNEDGTFKRSQGFGQPGHWWILIHEGQFMKPKIARRIRQIGVDVLDHVMLTRLLVRGGCFVGAMGYHVLDGSFHVIRAKTGVLAMGPRVQRAFTNSTLNPFNSISMPFNVGAHYILAYEAGARLVNFDTKQTASVEPKSFGCPGMNGITGSGAHALNSLGERFMTKYHPMTEQAPRHLFARGLVEESLKGNGPPFYMDMRHLPDDVRNNLEFDLMPGDKGTWPDYSAQRGLDFKTKLMEVEVSEIRLEGMVFRDKNFESTVPGLFVGTGFHAFSGAMCGGYAAAKNAARQADAKVMPDFPSREEIDEEQTRVMLPLESGGETSAALFEKAIRQIMRYYMGYVRNEIGMKQGLESLDRLASKVDDLYAANMHELMRVHEAQNLLQVCRLFTMASIERRETSSKTLCLRSDYPDPDPSFTVLAIEKRGENPFLYWM